MADRPHLQYVDNFAVLGEKREEVDADLAKVCDELRRRGLALHKEEVTEGETRLLGWVLSGEECALRSEGRRVWRLRFAIHWALRVGEISGRDLERLIGHAVFMALCRRKSLAILGSVYSFVAAEPTEWPRRLWCSVRRELDMLDALLPLLWQPLDAAWAEDVTMVDASPWGLGAVRAQMDAELVRRTGAQLERWRFHGPRMETAPGGRRSMRCWRPVLA